MTTQNQDFDPNSAPTGPRRSTRELLPTGQYLVTIKWIEPDVASTGTKSVAVTFEVKSGTHTGRTIIDRCFLTAGAKWKLATLAKCVGVKSKFSPYDIKQLLDLFQGKDLTIYVSADEYQGNEQRKVASFDSLIPEVRAELREERNKKFAGTRNKKGGKPAAATTSHTTSGGDEIEPSIDGMPDDAFSDEVPF